MGSLLGPIFGRKKLFWDIFWVYKLESDFVPILGSNFNVFSLFFGCFLGVSFTCVAFRVDFANVRFIEVKRGFVRSSDVTKYISFVIFGWFFLTYFCMHFRMDLGTILGGIWGRIWSDFSGNL